MRQVPDAELFWAAVLFTWLDGFYSWCPAVLCYVYLQSLGLTRLADSIILLNIGFPSAPRGVSSAGLCAEAVPWDVAEVTLKLQLRPPRIPAPAPACSADFCQGFVQKARTWGYVSWGDWPQILSFPEDPSLVLVYVFYHWFFRLKLSWLVCEMEAVCFPERPEVIWKQQPDPLTVTSPTLISSVDLPKVEQSS